MWLVIDTNQARLVPETLRRGRIAGRAKGLSLPPYLMAEVLKRGEGPRADTLARFNAHPVRIGVEPAMVMDTLARLNANQIPNYIPFPTFGDDIDKVYRSLLRETAATVRSGPARWSVTVTTDNQKFMAGMAAIGIKARRELVRRRAGEIENFAEALKMTNGPESFIGSLIVAAITNGTRRPTVVKDPAALVRAVLKNPYLRHFYHAILYYILSVTRTWQDEDLHRRHNKNDWTDLTMALYVGSYDVLVTEDGLLRAVFKMIDPAVRVVSAADL